MTTDFEQHQSAITKLYSDVKSLSLATMFDENSPLVSYTPFASSKSYDKLWILVSDLAVHSKNLKKYPTCSVLIMRDETESPQIYLRERVQLEMTSSMIERSSAEWRTGCDALRERHGDLLNTLEQLTDFHLFTLRPAAGRYVVGFGKAFELVANSLNTIDFHLQGPTGPQKD